MTFHQTTLGKTAPREKRNPAPAQAEFTCKACGSEWDAPAHAWWLSKMRCSCGEVVEAR